ncbi:hypothetical protein J2Z40_002290 [Cytobacillus eiseniae]|uniref:Uncharacterized protein n=1 Tax=Cytobacillus eiseniae TaxID=762947 RepID=A0ABS4RG30_9BACI|nr:hypothetical protein [Cytobacillus eiseniae]
MRFDEKLGIYRQTLFVLRQVGHLIDCLRGDWSLGKQLEFVYHPNPRKVDEEIVREVHYMLAQFLVKKALKKAT